MKLHLGDKFKMDPDKKTRFVSSQIDEKNQEFETLLAKFRVTIDPVERYIKRMKMKELKTWLSLNGVDRLIP